MFKAHGAARGSGRGVSLSLVGIIANPAASKDIRRLVAQGRVIPDWEKVNTIRRVLLGLQSTGIERVVAMPDASHLCRRSADDTQVSLELELLDMPAFYHEGDTLRAAALMQELGVQCLVTLGGDGTNRAAAAGSVEMPMVAISTGTNNVFPTMVEGTLAGLAAGLVAQRRVELETVSVPSKTLRIYVDGEFKDMALVDVAFSQERFVAARAIWDLSTLYEVFLTRAEPSSIGLAAVGAALRPVSLPDDLGLRYTLAAANGESENLASNKGEFRVVSPIAPGVMQEVVIADWQELALGRRLELDRRHATVALDGERSFSVTPEQLVEIELNRDGPRVVSVEATLRAAAEKGLFRRGTENGP